MFYLIGKLFFSNPDRHLDSFDALTEKVSLVYMQEFLKNLAIYSFFEPNYKFIPRQIILVVISIVIVKVVIQCFIHKKLQYTLIKRYDWKL